MEFPSELTEIVDKASAKYPTDIDKATDVAMREVRKLPNYEDVVAALLRHAIRELVYDSRHKANVATKRQTGYYGVGAKVTVGSSVVVDKVYRSVYAYHIAGKVLGDLIGDELPDLIVKETEIANGHLFNAALLQWVGSQGVVGDKKVREVISEKKLRLNFDRIFQEVQRKAS